MRGWAFSNVYLPSSVMFASGADTNAVHLRYCTLYWFGNRNAPSLIAIADMPWKIVTTTMLQHMLLW